MLLKETSRKFLTFFLELNCLLYSRFWSKQNKEESRFFEPPRKKQIGSNYWEVWKIGGEITAFDRWKEVKFGSNYREFRKTEGAINWDSTACTPHSVSFTDKTLLLARPGSICFLTVRHNTSAGSKSQGYSL